MEAISGCKTIQEIAVDHAIHLGRGQVNGSHAMPLRLAIDDQPNQDRAPVHAFVEAGGD